jgi:peptidyl-prolyl cis-trans isomerase C
LRSTLFLTALLIACETAPPETTPGELAPSGEVVMVINGDLEVHANALEAVMARIPPDQLARMEGQPGGMKRIEDQFAMSQILYKRALEADLHNEAEVLDGMAMAQREYLASVFVQRSGDDAATDEAIAKRYAERQVQYARPQVSARHILVKEESLANELLGKVKAGGDFAALASEHSTDPGSKIKGGDLGWFEQRRMDPAFGEAAFAAEKGDIVGPVESRYGFHVIEVQDKRESVPLEDVKEELANGLRTDARQAMLTELQASLKITKPGQPDAPEAAPAAVLPGGPRGLPPGHPAARGAVQVNPGAMPAKPSAPPALAPAPAPAPAPGN